MILRAMFNAVYRRMMLRIALMSIALVVGAGIHLAQQLERGVPPGAALRATVDRVGDVLRERRENPRTGLWASEPRRPQLPQVGYGGGGGFKRISVD